MTGLAAWLLVSALVLLPLTLSLHLPPITSTLSHLTPSPPSPSPSPSPVPLLPHSVRIEHLKLSTHPDLVIDTHNPRFHWRLPSGLQSSYQLLITPSPLPSSSANLLSSSSSPLFDSGAIASPLTSHHYRGPAFTSDTRYTFHLRFLPSLNSSLWSPYYTGTFRTALFSPSDWHGQWIGAEVINMNQLRRQFTLPATPIVSATVFLCGVGYALLDVNGAPVDPTRRLDPGWSTYQYRSLYVSFDLTHNLTAGVNALGVTLGSGWYSQQPWLIGPGARPDLSAHYGVNRFLLQLNVRLADNSTLEVTSDTQWQGREAEHRMDGVYAGSVVDLRAARPDFSSSRFVDPTSLWLNASVLPSPLDPSIGVLSLQMMDPVRAGADSIHVATASTPLFSSPLPFPQAGGQPIAGSGVLHPTPVGFSNGQVWDVTQNMAGYCELQGLTLPRGFVVQQRHAELRYDRGANGMPYATVDAENYQTVAATNTFVFSGRANETARPAFTYVGFRYLQVTGLADDGGTGGAQVVCFPVHSETTVTGNFSSTSLLINQIYRAMQWSQLSNSVSLPTDCPQRNERRGWLGDAGLSVDFALSSFALVPFYANFAQLIADAQDASGAVPDTVPFTVGAQPADPNWGTAFVRIPWSLYEHTGDVDFLRTHYDGVKGWLDCLLAIHAKQGVRNFYSSWGDWETIGRGTNASLVASFPLLRDVSTFVQMAQALDDHANAQAYNTTYRALADEWHSVWYRPDLVGYGDGSQAANALALALPDVVPSTLRKQVAANLAANIRAVGHMDSVGIVSVAQLFPVLSSNGYHDLALELIQQTAYPSFGYMFNNGVQNATTIWESWDLLPNDSGSSLNHHMYNEIGAWFYRYLAGIVPHPHHVRVHPRLSRDPDLLRRVAGEMEVEAGQVRVEWERLDVTEMGAWEEEEGDVTLRLAVVIPPGGRGELVLDAVSGDESLRCQTVLSDEGAMVWQRDGEGVRGAQAGLTEWAEDGETGAVTAQMAAGLHHLVAFWGKGQTQALAQRVEVWRGGERSGVNEAVATR